MKVEILGIYAGECEDYDTDSYSIYYTNFTPSKEFLEIFPNFPNKKIKLLNVESEIGNCRIEIYEGEECEKLTFNAIIVVDKAHLVLQDLE